MLTYLTKVSHIHHLASEHNIFRSKLSFLSCNEKNTLAKFIYKFAVVQRMAIQLKPDHKITITFALRMLRKLTETLQIMKVPLSSRWHYSDSHMSFKILGLVTAASTTVLALKQCSCFRVSCRQSRIEILLETYTYKQCLKAFLCTAIRGFFQVELHLFGNNKQPDMNMHAPQRVFLIYQSTLSGDQWTRGRPFGFREVRKRQTHQRHVKMLRCAVVLEAKGPDSSLSIAVA